MDSRASALLNELTSRVGDLSDLRYGQFSQASAGGEDLGTDVLASLNQLESICRSEGA